MSEHNDCGHTDEEHEQQKMSAMLEAAQSGNFITVLGGMDNELLAMNMGGLVEEIFIRARNDEEFTKGIKHFVDDVLDVLVEGNQDAEIRETLLKFRTEHSERVENQNFVNEAGTELTSMFGEHGVLEAPAASPAKSDEWPGQYL